MEKYREELNRQNTLLSISCIILGIFVTLTSMDGNLLTLPHPGAGSRWPDFWRGFCTGAATGLLLVLVFFLARNLHAINDASALKKLYVKTHDERTEKIYTTARSTAMQIFLLGGPVAVCVVGYFSMAASLAILGCVIFCCAACIALKFYFSAKM